MSDHVNCVQNTIITLARNIARTHWTEGSDVSLQTKAAQLVCRLWQEAVLDNFPNRFTAECLIGEDCNQKIDLVDSVDLIAYELKVSPNNTHFEFYRDIFKVWIQREFAHQPLKKFVFITPERGAARLRNSFCEETMKVVKRHGFDIEIAVL